MTPALEEAQRLLRIARRDQDTLSLLIPLPTASLAALGFHAQQAVEKCLKALCTLLGVEVRRTHDLAALATLLVDHGETSPVTIDQFRELNPFAVEFRYDDEMTSRLGREELQSIVRTVIDWTARRANDAGCR
jgi:HEPN domain-containing protein